MSKQLSSEEMNTIRMMKIYQSNVKQDISNTSDVIRLVQEKLNSCSESLASLKQVASELNTEYKDLESQVDTIGHRVKAISTSQSSSGEDDCASSLSRTSSMSSLIDCGSTSDSVFEQSFDELDSTYVFVHGKTDGTASEDELERSASHANKWRMKKRKRVSLGYGSSASTSTSDGYHDEGSCSSSSGGGSSAAEDSTAHRANCFDENDKIIRGLQKEWTM